MDSRVGYATTSILEQILRDYISLHTVNNKYTGEYMYLNKLKDLIEYNKGEKVEKYGKTK